MTTETLPGWLAKQAETRAYNTALRYKRLGVWHQKTWIELQREILHLAHHLKLEGFSKGDTLFLLSNPRFEASLLSIAAQWLGGTAAPLNPEQETVSLLLLLRELKPSFVFAENQLQVDHVLELQLENQTIIYADERGLADYNYRGLLSYSSLLGSSYADIGLESVAADSAFTFYRLDEQKQLESQALSHSEILQHGSQLIESEELTPSEDALASRTIAASGYAKYLLGPWLIAGFRLNYPENIDTRDNDRRELGPTLVAGTAITYQRLFDQVQTRLPLHGSLTRAIFDWAINTTSQSNVLRKLLAQWLFTRPLRDVIGLSRTRVALLVGEPLPRDSAEFFIKLGIQIRAWPDSVVWKSAEELKRTYLNKHSKPDSGNKTGHFAALAGAGS